MNFSIGNDRLKLRVSQNHWLFTVPLACLSGGRTIHGTLVMIVVLTVTFLVHELGHALTAMAFGASAEIELHGYGGFTRHKAASPLSTWKECLIVMDGPLANLAVVPALLFSFSTAAAHWSAILQLAASQSIRVNLIWGLFNALPIEPMDGGHLLQRVLHRFFGLRGLKAASVTTIGCGSVGTLIAALLHQYFVAATLAIFCIGACQQLAKWSKRTAQDEDPALQEEYGEARKDMAARHFDDAITRFAALRKQCAKGVIYTASTEMLARIFVLRKDYGAAYPLLLSIEKEIGYDSLKLLQQLACDAGDVEKALSLGARLFPERNEAYVAYVNSAAEAKRGRQDEAIEWMKTALRLGLADPAKAFAEPEFDSVRELERFRELLGEHAAGEASGK